MNNVKSKTHSGFTLMEISIVVTLIIVIGLIILVSLNPLAQILKGYDTRRKSDLAQLKIAFENYYSDHDCYPQKEVLSNCGSADLMPYLTKIPCDPNDGTPYKIHTIPADSVCPQQYAIYGSMLSFFDTLANSIPGCPKTFSVHSSDMLNADISIGCGGPKVCSVKYGCINGFCSVVALDVPATCDQWSCNPDCGADCAIQRDDGSFVNECDPLPE